MATQKRQASVLGSTLTSLTLNSDLSSSLSEDETSEGDDEDLEDSQQAKRSGGSAVDASDNDHDTEHEGKTKKSQEKEGKKTEKLSKPRARMKTLTIDGQLVYFCLLCDKIFTRRKDKINHELAHSSESVLTCTECGKEYFHESSLAYHMRSHDADQLHLCDLCPKMFAQGHHLKTHILSHSHPTEFTCKTCHQDFALASDLSEHIRKKIKEEMTMYWCKMCKVYFCRNHSDTKDIQNLHAHQCTACNELFFSHKKLRLHMKKFAHKSFNKPKALEPLAAEEMFVQKSSKRRDDHWNTSTKAIASGSNSDSILKKRSLENNDENCKPFPKKRRLASKSFVSQAILSSSSLQDSAPDIKPDLTSLKSPLKRKGKPYCKKCNKSFKDISELDTHKLLAHGETPKLFACNICHQRFPSQQAHDNHKGQHKKEEMHTCPICGQDFFLGVDLTKHLKEHSGDFPYKCNQCGKAFRLKLQLIQHIRLHIPQTPLACDKCGLQMSCRKDLDEHLLSVHPHEEKDEFKCHLCNKLFQYRYKLQNHLRVHTNVKTFQCYVCHKSFVAKHFLQHHLQIHLRQGMDVKVAKFIKTESEEDTVVKEKMVEGVNVEDKTVPGEKIKDESLLGHGDVKKSGFKQVKSNSTSSLLKLNFQKLPEENSSDSGESACSVLTRESEKSDPFRFSSDGSDRVKFSMAKERRRMRKKKQLSRLVLYNKLNALKNEEERQTKSLSRLTEEIQTCNTIHDMTVEINGVCSQADNEVILYVELQTLKPLLNQDLLTLSSQNIDSTNKENRLPRSLNMEQLLMARTNFDLPDKDHDLSMAHNNAQTLVLDLEMDDDALNTFLAQEKVMDVKQQNSDNLESVSSHFDLANKPSKDLETSADRLAPRGNQSENLSSDSQQKLEKLQFRKPSSPALKGSNFPSDLERDIVSDMAASSESKPQLIQSDINSNTEVKSAQSIQPLQSLHLMTAQIDNPHERRSKFSKKERAFLQGMIKSEEFFPTSVPFNISSKSDNQTTCPSSLSAHDAHDIIDNSDLNFHKLCKRKASSPSNKSPVKSTHQTVHKNKDTTVIQSDTEAIQSGSYNFVSRGGSFNPQSHSLNSFHSAANSESQNISSTSENLKPEAMSSRSGTVSSSGRHKSSSSQLTLTSLSAKSSLPHSKRPVQIKPKLNRPSDVAPRVHLATMTTITSSIANPSSTPALASSHFHESKFSTSKNLTSDSKALPTSSSEFSMPFKPALIYPSRQSDSTDPGSINNSQIFDPKNPSLRDMNMLDLIGPNHGSTNVSLAPPTSVFTTPSHSINSLSENQNLNAGTFYRPVTPSTILPTQLGQSSSTVFLNGSISNSNPNIPLPGMAGNVLFNDIPCPSLPLNNSDLPLMNSFNFNLNYNGQGHNLAPSNMGPPLPLDLGLANLPGIRPLGNFDGFSSAANLAISGPSFPLPVANVGVGVGGLDIMPLNNINQNPSSFVNMDAMGSARGHPQPMRPMTMAMTNFDTGSLFPIGGAGIQPSFNPGGMPSLNIAANSPAGTLLPQGAGSFGLPMINPNALMPNPPNAQHATVNLPLGMPVVPDSGLMLPPSMGLLGPMNPGPFLPM